MEKLEFPIGENGTPLPGAVLEYCLSVAGQQWTRQRLADTLGISKRQVYRMIDDTTGIREGWDSMKRREAIVNVFAPIMAALGINKSYLGELFGIIVTQDESPQTRPRRNAFNVHVDLDGYEKKYLEYGENHGLHRAPPQDILCDVLKKIQHMYRALPHTEEKKRLMRLLINYHCFAAMMYQETTNYQDSVHMLVLARQLADSDKHAYGDLIARSYDLQGGSLVDQKQYLQALRYFERAQHVAKHASIPLSLATKIDSCHADCRLRVGMMQQDQDAVKQGMRTMQNLRERIARGGGIIDPENMIRFDNDRMEMDIAVHFGFIGQYKRSLEALEQIYLPPAAMRRRAYVEVRKAEALFYLGEYTGSAELAINALDFSHQAASMINQQRTRDVYNLLNQSPAYAEPTVRRLGLLLSR